MTRQQGLKRKAAEEDIQEALNAIHSGTVKNAVAAEKKYGVSWSTLGRRLKGKSQNRTAAHEAQQLLTNPEEAALVQWLTQLTIAGYPARYNVLREMAEELLKQRVATVNTDGMILAYHNPIGLNWPARFLERHAQMTSLVSQQIDLVRWKDPTHAAIRSWFEAYQAQTVDVRTENIYNMDETGFGIGTEECSQVIIVESTLRTRYKTNPGRQEWVSVVECICADGTTIPPYLIFKGDGINSNILSDEVPLDWCFGASSKGWTSNIRGLEWLQRCWKRLMEVQGYSFVTDTIAI